MNYLKHYVNLIHKAQNRNLYKLNLDYTEKHHIIPKSCNGVDNTYNLVILNYKEHFIAHLLLYKIYKNVDKFSGAMASAIIFMTRNRKFKFINSRNFERIKIEKKIWYHKYYSGKNHNKYGTHHSDETKEKIRKANIGRIISKEAREKISKANTGNKISYEDTQKRISKIIGTHRTEETKRRISESNKGRKVSQETKNYISLRVRLRNFKWSEEDKKKMSEKRKGTVRSRKSVDKSRGVLVKKYIRNNIELFRKLDNILKDNSNIKISEIIKYIGIVNNNQNAKYIHRCVSKLRDSFYYNIFLEASKECINNSK